MGLKQFSQHKNINYLSNDTISMNMLYTQKTGQKWEKVPIGIWWKDIMVIFLAYWGIKAGFVVFKAQAISSELLCT